MNDRNVHPLIRYGGPILGAVLVYFIITSMIGGFQADMEAARVTPLPVVDEVAVEEGAAAEAPMAEEVPAPEEAPVAEEAPAAETSAEEAAAPAVDDSATVTETETITETVPLTESETVTDTAPVVETTEVTTTTEIGATEPLTVTEEVAEPEAAPAEAPAEEPAEVPATPESAAPAETVETAAELPAEIAAFFPDNVDPVAGEQTALTSGCTACHSLLPDVVQVGPSWYDVANHAVERVPGQSAEVYLYTSITDPNAYVVPDFQPGLMPNIYNQLLTEEQIANIMAYLLTLEGE